MANQEVGRYMPRGPMPLTEAMNQLLRESFTGPFGFGSGSTMTVGMNLYETNDSYIVQVMLPGVQPDQVSITTRENVVTLQGTMEIPAPQGARSIYAGAARGQFRESIQLPGDVDAERANATYENGILTLTLPKAASARERSIRISRSDGQNQADRQGQMPGQGQMQGQGQQQMGQQRPRQA